MDPYNTSSSAKRCVQISRSNKAKKQLTIDDKENSITATQTRNTSSVFPVSSNLQEPWHCNVFKYMSTQSTPFYNSSRTPLSDVSNGQSPLTPNINSSSTSYQARQNRISIIADKKRKSLENRSKNKQKGKIAQVVETPNFTPFSEVTHNLNNTWSSNKSFKSSSSVGCITPVPSNPAQYTTVPFDLDTPISILAREIFSPGTTSSYMHYQGNMNTPDVQCNNLQLPNNSSTSWSPMTYFNNTNSTRTNKSMSRMKPTNEVSSIQLEVDNEDHCDSIKKLFGISKEYLDHGDPTYICTLCCANVWLSEANTNNRRLGKTAYSICCGNGKVQLPQTPEPPQLFINLFSNKHPSSKNFIKHIRKYNNTFCFTSMGGKIDNSINNGRGPYVFRLSGQNCHRLGSLLPIAGNTPKYSQLYIYDTENEDQHHMNSSRPESRQREGDESIEPELIHQIKIVLDQCNRLVKAYRMARDGFAENPDQGLKLKLIGGRKTDGRNYNLPTVSELAGLIIGDMDSGLDQRDIIVEKQSGQLKRISELHPSYLALQYPLLFPLGQDGYRPGIKHRNVDDNTKCAYSEVTIREFFAYLIQERCNSFSLMHSTKKLYQQFLVDAYTMMESDRLKYIRAQQKKLRLDSYNDLCNNVNEGNTRASNTGK